MKYNQTLRQAVNRYKEANPNSPVLTRDVADWMMRTGQWKPKTSKLIDLLARDLSDAMRTEYFEDEQGRRVRRKHSVREKIQDEFGKWNQLVLWDNIDTANPQFMQKSFQQRRVGIADECFQLKQDMDHFNDNFNKGKPLQLWLDFTDDVADRESALSNAGETADEEAVVMS